MHKGIRASLPQNIVKGTDCPLSSYHNYRTPEIQKQLTNVGVLFLVVLVTGRYIITEY